MSSCLFTCIHVCPLKLYIYNSSRYVAVWAGAKGMQTLGCPYYELRLAMPGRLVHNIFHSSINTATVPNTPSRKVNTRLAVIYLRL